MPRPSSFKKNSLEKITDNLNHNSDKESSKISYNKQEDIAEKVEEDTFSKSHNDNNSVVVVEDDTSLNNNHIDYLVTKNPAEEMVREWEVTHETIKLPPRIRELALFAASIHLYEKGGITVRDLEKLGDTKDNAEKKIQDARRSGLLIPHETIKSGKQKQYFLSNYKHIIDDRIRKRRMSKLETNDEDKLTSMENDIAIKLLQLLSNRKYTYHNIHLETSLNYKKDYDSIKWFIPSNKNKQKVKTFNLGTYHKCKIIVSPNGTVNITIECTLDPYELHTPEGLIEFFGSCGQVLSEIQAATNNRLHVVPSISDWFIRQFDYGKDIPVTSDPMIITYAAQGILKIKYLGVVFQIYPKGLPEVGNNLRIEGQYNTKENKKIKDLIPDIVMDKKEKRSPFVTAEDLLLQNHKKGI